MMLICLLKIKKILLLEQSEEVNDYFFRDDGEDGNNNLCAKHLCAVISKLIKCKDWHTEWHLNLCRQYFFKKHISLKNGDELLLNSIQISFLMKKQNKTLTWLLTVTWCHFSRTECRKLRNRKVWFLQKIANKIPLLGPCRKEPGSSPYLHLTTTWMFFPFSSFADEFSRDATVP